MRPLRPCPLTRGWSGPVAERLVTAGPHVRPAAQPQIVSWAGANRSGDKTE
jgi:hypothetical protein